MNELRFLKVIGKIDEELLREADVDIEKEYSPEPVSKRGIYAFGSAAAAAVAAVISVSVYNSQSQTELPVEHLIIEDISDKNSDEPDDNYENLAADTTKPIVSSALNEDEIQKTSQGNSKETSAKDTESEQSTAAKNLSEQSPTDVSETSDEAGNKSGISVENCYLQPFTATVDPDFDGYGEDELHHIDVRTAYGNYRQLRLDEYDLYGIPAEIAVSDFGEYIGKIIEVDDHEYHGNQAESQEPAIAEADVYYYSGSSGMEFIIVKKGEQCSIFFSDDINTDFGFQNGLSFFNVNSADDIQAIDFHIDVPDESGGIVTTVQKTITDTEAIKKFYELICQLKPENYSDLPDHIGTPQWLIDAWANYNSDPASEREDHGISIKLKSGIVLQEIWYFPYLGNGYVDGMQELTKEQNSVLKELLK